MKLHKKPNNSGFAIKLLAVGLFCFLLLPVHGFAKTLAEYREGVKSAGNFTEELLDYVSDVLDEGEKDAEYERGVLAELRKTLPVTEKIEWEGTSVETGNQWLEAKLKAFEEETKDWEKRRIILTEISERLSAIEKQIDQLEKPALAAAERSKDEEKRKLGEILRREEYQKPAEQQESWFERMQKKVRDWFNEKFPRTNVPESTTRGLSSLSFGLQVLLYALVLGFIAFLIYRFAPFFADRFRRGKKEEKEERIILGEKLAANEDAQTLFDEAEAMAHSGNLRGAIRKGYIALLCELSDRKLIGLAQHKTNRDYLRDVRKKGELYQNMNGLTVSFERHWYGFDDANEADWNEFKQIYQKTISS
jgi:hypothetical protein